MKNLIFLAVFLLGIAEIVPAQSKRKKSDFVYDPANWVSKKSDSKIQESQTQQLVKTSSTNETNTLNNSVKKSDSEDDNGEENTGKKQYKTSLDYSDGYYNYDDSYDYTIYKPGMVCASSTDNVFWKVFQNMYAFTGGYGYNYGYNNYYNPLSYGYDYGYGYNNYYNPRSHYRNYNHGRNLTVHRPYQNVTVVHRKAVVSNNTAPRVQHTSSGKTFYRSH